MRASDVLQSIEAEIAEIESLLTQKQAELATLVDGAAVLAKARVDEIRICLERLKIERVDLSTRSNLQNDENREDRS